MAGFGCGLSIDDLSRGMHTVSRLAPGRLAIELDTDNSGTTVFSPESQPANKYNK
jgi:hypothetical protein